MSGRSDENREIRLRPRFPQEDSDSGKSLLNWGRYSNLPFSSKIFDMNDWQSLLAGEKEKPYFKELLSFVEQERSRGRRIFPQKDEVFSALRQTPFEEVKVVILGQDPYHGVGQAHGLAFSVPEGVRIPPSLLNIYKELKGDLQITPPSSGNLTPWAKQGVLLLNSILTVEESKAGSHAGRGWEQFTDRIVLELVNKGKNIVFLLWGSYAQKKATVGDVSQHLFLKAPHPSPLSAHRGFLGCKHFSQANEYLIKVGRAPIDWGAINSDSTFLGVQSQYEYQAVAERS